MRSVIALSLAASAMAFTSTARPNFRAGPIRARKTAGVAPRMGVASEEMGIPCEDECALPSYPNMPASVHPGVVTGQALKDLLQHAQVTHSRAARLTNTATAGAPPPHQPPATATAAFTTGTGTASWPAQRRPSWPASVRASTSAALPRQRHRGSPALAGPPINPTTGAFFSPF